VFNIFLDRRSTFPLNRAYLWMSWKADNLVTNIRH